MLDQIVRHAVFEALASDDEGHFACVARKIQRRLPGRVSCADQMHVMSMDRVCLAPRGSIEYPFADKPIDAFDGEKAIPFAVDNPWFRGQSDVTTFSIEEMLATKLRALLQRDKGRDLLDLGHAFEVHPRLDDARIVHLFLKYLGRSNLQISRAEAEQRMFAKLDKPRFMSDIKPLLATQVAAKLSDEAISNHHDRVMSRLIALLPGGPWAGSDERRSR